MDLITRDLSEEDEQAEKLVLETVMKVLENNETMPLIEEGLTEYKYFTAADYCYRRWSSAEPSGKISNENLHNFIYPEKHLYFHRNFWPNPGYHKEQNYHEIASYRNSRMQNVPLMRPVHFNKKFCNFCKRNGETNYFYTSHYLYEDNQISCPVLKECVCKSCGGKGHTVGHCLQRSPSVLKMIHRSNMI